MLEKKIRPSYLPPFLFKSAVNRHAPSLPCPRHHDPDGYQMFVSKQEKEQHSDTGVGKMLQCKVGEICRTEADLLQRLPP